MAKQTTPQVECYSREGIKNIAHLCDGEVDGTVIVSCHPKFRSTCDRYKRCLNLFSQGTYWKKRQLASMLKKPVEKLTKNDFYRKAKELEKQAYLKCRKVIVSVSEASG